MRHAYAALCAAAIALPCVVRADIPPTYHPPPVGARITGESSSITTQGAPDHAIFDVSNPTGTAVTLSIRQIQLVGQTTSTLRITGVNLDGPRANPAAIRIRPRSHVRIFVGFSGIPAALANAQAYDFVLQVTLAGLQTSANAHVARAIREPIRDIVITS